LHLVRADAVSTIEPERFLALLCGHLAAGAGSRPT
jgi:hypothetical protein